VKILLNSVNKLMFAMVTSCVLFEVRTEFLNVISSESWNKILPSLSQAFTTHHPNVCTPILSLSEGRAGIAWVPSNKMLFSPSYKAPLAFPQVFSLYFYSYTVLSDSLSLLLQSSRRAVAEEASKQKGPTVCIPASALYPPWDRQETARCLYDHPRTSKFNASIRRVFPAVSPQLKPCGVNTR
jgi:hypothetical protein